jgi:hypothetical protein
MDRAIYLGEELAYLYSKCCSHWTGAKGMVSLQDQ